MDNGFHTFTLGILFILTIYHFLLFFQQQDRLYLLYSSYTFLIMLSQLRHIKEGFLYPLVSPFMGVLQFPFPMFYTEIYYCIYMVFCFQFLDMKNRQPIWNRQLQKAVWAVVFFCIGVVLVYLIAMDSRILINGYRIFGIVMSVLAIIFLIPIYQSKHPLRLYLFLGSLLLLVFSSMAMIFYTYYQIHGLPDGTSYGILYVGIILENILFSLGLGQKQKIILDERNESQEKLIAQLRENELLRQKVQENLENEVAAKVEEIERERIKGLRMEYAKELAELKVLALRSQMNPHFIFNSLNSIKRYIIDNDKGNAVYYMNKFSKLIRKVLSSTMEKESSLEDELETMELYVNIENIRFNNQIAFELKVAPELKTNRIKVPSLLLQPFLENAIWHGLSPKKTDMALAVQVDGDDSFVSICIEDNGIGRTKANEIRARRSYKGPSAGIYLSTERLQHFGQHFRHEGSIVYEDKWGTDGEALGTVVRIKVPIC